MAPADAKLSSSNIHVGGLSGYVTAGHTHGNANVGRPDRWRQARILSCSALRHGQLLRAYPKMTFS
jgi:hypothetical protein